MIIRPHDPHQEALDFKIDEQGYFASFVPGENGALIEVLRAAVTDCPHELFYLFGPPGAGKTHLLTALFRMQKHPPVQVFFADLTLAPALSPLLLSIDAPRLIILDNVEAIAGDEQWELALFGLYNRWVDARAGAFIVSASSSADRLPFVMHDLVTRFENGVSLPLTPLSDADCARALRLKAQLRGFKMPERVAAYLVRHLNRDMRRLTQVLDRLDKATLQAQHELTVPFVKKILEQELS